MKKIISLLSMILISFCFHIPAFAQSTEYIITGTDVSLSIPNDFEVFTRSNIANNAYLESLGYTQSEYLSMMKQKNVYMEAAKLDEGYTIVLTVIKTTGEDFDGLSNDEKKSLIDDTKSTFSESGISINKSNFAEINNNTYLVLEYLRRSENDVIDVFCIQYSTIVNGYAYNFAIDSFEKKLSTDSLKEIENIMNSVGFNYTPIYNSGDINNIKSDVSIGGILGGSIGVVLWALVPGFIAKRKNRSFWGYFLISFIISPLVSTIVILCMDRNDKDSTVEERKTKTAPTIKSIYLVDQNIPAGKHRFVATNPEGGLIRILSNDNTLLDRIYVKKKKSINLKSGTIVNAFGCVAELYPSMVNTTNDSSKIRFCRKCGEKLIDNSIFCRKCGTEIVNVEED